MQQTDNVFFEEYKRLDKLCSEIYSCQNGLSEYIQQMEKEATKGQWRVSSWDSDYKMLKHVRWVRNQIAHDSGVEVISEPEDLYFVQDFYGRIFSGQDSLTLLRKVIESENERRRQQQRQKQDLNSVQNSKTKKKSRAWVGLLIGLGVAFIFIGIFVLFLIYYYSRSLL